MNLLKMALPPLMAFSVSFAGASAATIQMDSTNFVNEINLESASLGITVGNNTNRTVVVTIGGERTPENGISTLKFNGTDMNPAAISHPTTGGSTQTHASVYYLDLPDTGASISGTIDLVWNGNDNGFVLGAFSLYNVKSGGPVATDTGANNDGNSNPLTLDYAGGLAGDFVVESVASQGGGSGIINEPANISTLYDIEEPGGGGYAALAGYEAITGAGAISNTYNFNITNGAANRVRAAGALFTAVPEPSTTVLLGVLCSLSLVVRRRR